MAFEGAMVGGAGVVAGSAGVSGTTVFSAQALPVAAAGAEQEVPRKEGLKSVVTGRPVVPGEVTGDALQAAVLDMAESETTSFDEGMRAQANVTAHPEVVGAASAPLEPAQDVDESPATLQATVQSQAAEIKLLEQQLSEERMQSRVMASPEQKKPKEEELLKALGNLSDQDRQTLIAMLTMLANAREQENQEEEPVWKQLIKALLAMFAQTAYGLVEEGVSDGPVTED